MPNIFKHLLSSNTAAPTPSIPIYYGASSGSSVDMKFDIVEYKGTGISQFVSTGVDLVPYAYIGIDFSFGQIIYRLSDESWITPTQSVAVDGNDRVIGTFDNQIFRISSSMNNITGAYPNVIEWNTLLTSTDEGFDSTSFSVGLVSTGDGFKTGFTGIKTNVLSGATHNYFVVGVCDESGNLLWSLNLSDPTDVSPVSTSKLSFDFAGNVYHAFCASDGQAIVITKFLSADGTIQWQKCFSCDAIVDECVGIFADPTDGTVAIAFTTSTGTNILQLHPDSSYEWVLVQNVVITGWSSIARDTDHNTYVVGFDQVLSVSVLIKIDTNGTVLWARQLANTFFSWESLSLAITSVGLIYVFQAGMGAGTGTCYDPVGNMISLFTTPPGGIVDAASSPNFLTILPTYGHYVVVDPTQTCGINAVFYIPDEPTMSFQEIPGEDSQYPIACSLVEFSPQGWVYPWIASNLAGSPATYVGVSINWSDIYDYVGSGGLVITRRRDTVDVIWMSDTYALGKTSIYLESNESENNIPFISGYYSSGYLLSPNDGNQLNIPGADYVSWSFGQDQGFFSTVEYIGNGDTQTIYHSLYGQSGMIMIKSRTSTSPTTIWHRSTPGNGYFTFGSDPHYVVPTPPYTTSWTALCSVINDPSTFPKDACIAADGSVYVAVNPYGISKYSTDGAVLWNVGFGGLYALCVSVASSGNVYALFSNNDTSNQIFYLIKFDSTGAVLWSNTVENVYSYSDSNNIVICSLIVSNSDESLYLSIAQSSVDASTGNNTLPVVISKFSSTGSTIWSTSTNADGFVYSGMSIKIARIALSSDESVLWMVGVIDSVNTINNTLWYNTNPLSVLYKLSPETGTVTSYSNIVLSTSDNGDYDAFAALYLHPTTDGGLILSGSHIIYDNPTDLNVVSSGPIIIKISDSLTVEWSKWKNFLGTSNGLKSYYEYAGVDTSGNHVVVCRCQSWPHTTTFDYISPSGDLISTKIIDSNYFPHSSNLSYPLSKAIYKSDIFVLCGSNYEEIGIQGFITKIESVGTNDYLPYYSELDVSQYNYSNITVEIQVINNTTTALSSTVSTAPYTTAPSVLDYSYIGLVFDSYGTDTDAINHFGNNIKTIQPTNSYFTVGNHPDVNQNGVVYTAYIFGHEDFPEGRIFCDVLNTGTDTSVVVQTGGWRPQFLMLFAPMYNEFDIIDTMRGMSSEEDSFITAGISEQLAPPFITISDTPPGILFQIFGEITGFPFVAVRESSRTYLTVSGDVAYNSVIYPMTGASQDVLSGIMTEAGRHLAPDLVITHQINVTTPPGGVNWTTRRVGPSSSRDSTVAEPSIVSYGDGVVSLNSDGMSLSGDLNGINPSTEGGFSVAWFFKCCYRIFDVVHYTAAPFSQTITHQLGGIPYLLITKGVYNSSDWYVYVALLGVNSYLRLNSSDPVVTSPGIIMDTPTTSQFTVAPADGTIVNLSDLMENYLFSTTDGASSVGLYTGDGTASQIINCTFTEGARFILIKCTSSAGNWYVWDSARGIYPLGDSRNNTICLNTTDGPLSCPNSVGFDPTGFAVGQDDITNVNVMGETYLYLAIS